MHSYDLAAPDKINITHPSPHAFAISIGASMIFLVFAFIIKGKGNRGIRKLEFLTPWFMLLAGIGLGAAFLSGWVATGLGALDAVPYVGGVLPKVFAAVCLYIVCYDLWPKHPSTGLTEGAAFILPSLASEIGGSLGTTLSEILSGLATTGDHLIATLIGQV